MSKVKNPITGRMINIGGGVYKKLVKEGKISLQEDNKNNEDSGKIRNPITGRLISVKGATYKKLVKSGAIGGVSFQSKIKNSSGVAISPKVHFTSPKKKSFMEQSMKPSGDKKMSPKIKDFSKEEAMAKKLLRLVASKKKKKKKKFFKINILNPRKKKRLSVSDCLDKRDRFLDILYTARKPTKEERPFYIDMIDAVKGFDFFPTPPEYGRYIRKYIERYYPYPNTIDVYDIGAGTANLSSDIIENMDVNHITLVEINPTFIDFLKCFEKKGNVKVVNKSFFHWNPKFDKDMNNIIVVNPPYRGYLTYNPKSIETKWGKLERKKLIPYIKEAIKTNTMNDKDLTAKQLKKIKNQLKELMKEDRLVKSNTPVFEQSFWVFFLVRLIEMLYNQNITNYELITIIPGSKYMSRGDIRLDKMREGDIFDFSIGKGALSKRLSGMMGYDITDGDTEWSIEGQFLSRVEGFMGLNKSGKPRKVPTMYMVKFPFF